MQHYTIRLSARGLLFNSEESTPRGPIVCRTQKKKSREIRCERQCLEAELRCPRKTDREIMTPIKKEKTGRLTRWKMGWAGKGRGVWEGGGALEESPHAVM